MSIYKLNGKDREHLREAATHDLDGTIAALLEVTTSEKVIRALANHADDEGQERASPKMMGTSRRPKCSIDSSKPMATTFAFNGFRSVAVLRSSATIRGSFL